MIASLEPVPSFAAYSHGLPRHFRAYAGPRRGRSPSERTSTTNTCRPSRARRSASMLTERQRPVALPLRLWFCHAWVWYRYVYKQTMLEPADLHTALAGPGIAVCTSSTEHTATTSCTLMYQSIVSTSLIARDRERQRQRDRAETRLFHRRAGRGASQTEPRLSCGAGGSLEAAVLMPMSRTRRLGDASHAALNKPLRRNHGLSLSLVHTSDRTAATSCTLLSPAARSEPSRSSRP